jgi:hypothetical protein
MARLYTTEPIVSVALGELSEAERAGVNGIIESCSEAIEKHCGRWFIAEAGVRVFDGSGTQNLWIDDLLELGGVTIDGLAESTILRYPLNELPTTRLLRQYGERWPTGFRMIEVTGRWGYSETAPARVREACTMLVCASLRPGGRKPAEETLGVKSISVDGFSATFETVTLSDVNTWPPDVTRQLAAYRRMAVHAI